ncbi:MAG: energy transducer TonB [Acidobacteria bacterium]|nr:MAG: energy transducer TonB [Acidobacteriota bacterium]
MSPERRRSVFRRFRFPASLAGAVALTLVCFLVLPVLQVIGNPLRADLDLRSMDVAALPPPPPPPPEMEQPEPEEPEPPPPPPAAEPAAPLDLQQLELALSPSLGEGGFGELAVDLAARIAGAKDGTGSGQIFSLEELDQPPRPIFQRPPRYPPELLRARRRGTVYVVFMVDPSGRVRNAKVQKSTDPAFEKPALEAVREWRFEPGKRDGQAVSFRMRVPITFNAG